MDITGPIRQDGPIDHIVKKSDGIPIRYVFRFHLNPGLSAVKTMSGNSALIQITKKAETI